jgi:hypothetical protein
MRLLRRALLIAAVMAAGCQPEPEITVHNVPRLSVLQRFLGALIYHPDATWTFKLTGKELAVNPHKDDFDKLVHSARFNEQGELLFDQPAAWSRDDKQPEGDIKRYATFQVGPKEQRLECVIHKLPPNAGTVYDNVDRWRVQLGLYQMRPGDLQDFIVEKKVAGHEGYFIDFLGPGAAPGRAAMPRQHPDFAPRAAPMGKAPPVKAPSDLTYDVPKDWKQAAAVQFASAAWEVGDGRVPAKITITQAGGELAANINRWRGMLGLPQISEAAAERNTRDIQVGGRAGKLVEIVNPNAPAPVNAMIAVIVPDEPQNRVFVMRGPADIVSRQKTNFEAFVRSVRFKAE